METYAHANGEVTERPMMGSGIVKKVGMAVGVAGLVAMAGAAWMPSMQARPVNLAGLEQKEERVKIVPSYVACSGPKENCLATGCCKTSGHTCFMKKQGLGQCNETCTPGKQGFTCEIAGSHSVPAARDLPNSLYCFAVYTQNTGSEKKSYDLELLQAQQKFKASIFGCEAQDVFSDVTVDLGGGVVTKQVNDDFGEFHRIKRKNVGTWVNWGIFYQVWLQVRSLGKWQDKGWTVKVDADAVFIPGRLRDWATTQRDTPHGVYFENCKNVQYGFFGNLEVMSNTAVQVLTSNLEECHTQFAPCADDGCDWKYGAWGEDVFAQRCMDHHYVDKAEAFELTTDGCCPADRPADQKKNKKWHAPDCSKLSSVTAHPYKKPAEYFKCLGEIMQTQYSL